VETTSGLRHGKFRLTTHCRSTR